MLKRRKVVFRRVGRHAEAPWLSDRQIGPLKVPAAGQREVPTG